MIGRVYQVKHIEGGSIYVGSTTLSLKRRMYMHNPHTHTTLGRHMAAHPEDTYEMELLKEYEVDSQQELRAREQLWMCRLRRQHKDLINKNDALHGLHHKQQYYADHRDVINRRSREWSSTRITCECGKEVSRGRLPMHRLTDRHAARMARLG